MKNCNYELVSNKMKNTQDVPKDKNLYYRCSACKSIIPSLPKDNVGCQCGNIFIDIDYWRLSVKDFSLFEVLRKTGG
jgi:rRNA maturation endonuclease Nob1